MGTFITSGPAASLSFSHLPELLPTCLAQFLPLRKSSHQGEVLWVMKMNMDSDFEGRREGHVENRKALTVYSHLQHCFSIPPRTSPPAVC